VPQGSSGPIRTSDNNGENRLGFWGEEISCTRRVYLARRSSFSAGFLDRADLTHLAVRREGARWLPLAPVGLQGFVASSRAFRAPLQPDGLAV
jgi:hypothetical protein